MSQWAPVVAVGVINLVGLGVFFGAMTQRLKTTETAVEKLPGVCKESARVLDLEHLYECHPRAAKRATGHADVVQP